MADHYQKALEQLDEVDDLRKDLRKAYLEHAPGSRVADLHQKINLNLKLADIHATLAVRQALQDSAVPA